MIITRFTTIFLLLTLSLITKAQKDSFWLRNLNLMGEPKAVFALDDGYSLVLADSFDQISKQYKGIIFFKLDPNGKTVERKQLFKLDTTYIEQRLEKAEKVRDGYLFRWYYTYHKNDSIIKSKSYFAKVNHNGDTRFNLPTTINYINTITHRWFRFGSDSLLYFNITFDTSFIELYQISNQLLIEKIPRNDVRAPFYCNHRFHFFYERYLDSQPDSVWVHRSGFQTKVNFEIGKLLEQRLLIKTIHKSGYYFLGLEDNFILKTDTNLNTLWQTPKEFVNANIRPSVKDLQILKNEDLLVIADADNLFARVPYVSRISADGKVNYFKYHYPSPLDRYYDFDEGPKGELFLLSGSRLNQSADSVWLIKASRFGRTVSITSPVNNEFFSLYPNPAQSQLNVKFGRPTKGNLIIYTSAGKVALTKQFGRQNQLQIDLSELQSGNYVLKIVNRKGDVCSQLFNH